MKEITGLVKGLEDQAKLVRKEIIRMIAAAQSGHPGGSLSATDLLTALYFHEMKLDPKNPDWEDRDRFILSKGHCCPVVYACLALRGYYPVDTLLTLRAFESTLQGHPDMRKTVGLDATTGSLGQGLSLGVGLALAAKLAKKDYFSYVLMGDGEQNEGQIWEAACTAVKYQLGNLVGIVDQNGLQNDGPTDTIMPMESLAYRWRSFGWQVIEIDGHNMTEILHALSLAKCNTDKPSMLVCNTIKGKGVSYMENVVEWHSGAISDAQMEQAFADIERGV